MKRVLLVIAFFVFVSCAGAPPSPKPPEPSDPQDPDHSIACKAAETHLLELDKTEPCPEAHLPSGKPFAQFCVEKIKGGIRLSPKCIASVKSCKEIESSCN